MRDAPMNGHLRACGIETVVYRGDDIAELCNEAAAIADERKLKSQLDDEVKQAHDWEHRAMLAVKEGRDDLAKQALIRQQEHAERTRVIQQTWHEQSAETENLKGSLRQLNDKIEEAKRKRNLLIAKQKRAQAQRRIHETMSGLSDSSAFEAFNRMAEKIEEQERQSIAQAEVSEALGGDSLEQDFVRLEEAGGPGGADVEDKLLALKSQMGLLGDGSEEPKQLEAGDEPAAPAAAPAAPAPVVKDAVVEEVSEAEADSIPEAQLLSEFEELEEKQAEAQEVPLDEGGS